MKKFIISLLILVIIGGVVFFFGWVQLKLSPGEGLILFSKTNGWESELLKPGDFHWRWQALLPTNVTMYRVPTYRKTESISFSGDLPSGDVYATFINEPGAFRFQVDLSVEYQINSDAWVSLIQDGRFDPESPEQFFLTVNQSLSASIPTFLSSAASILSEGQSENALDTLQERLTSFLNSQIDEITVTSTSLKSISLPDTSLYQTTRDAYNAVVQATAEGKAEAARESTFEQDRLSERVRQLGEYGRVLEEYPTLLEYFSLQSTTGRDPLNLQALLTSIIQDTGSDE
ncbi:SPFH domain-containing protein [Spirochaeta lutea]|uniref:Band 7 domain-containing protein n=1 Tax=Spirochaeta lutea TaxID=1480694 RepID=A0A098R2P2_9SPIO|nr:SPFH domain-containing protein [Spirochaeta lutea]KGE73933.1 hypothetical protein DC28_01775 [Spirochaeta lutea]